MPLKKEVLASETLKILMDIEEAFKIILKFIKEQGQYAKDIIVQARLKKK